jgi:hypothetical protein
MKLRTLTCEEAELAIPPLAVDETHCPVDIKYTVDGRGTRLAPGVFKHVESALATREIMLSFSSLELTTLENMPARIAGNLNATGNNLLNCVGCGEVGRLIFVDGNKRLTSLEGCPQIIHRGIYADACNIDNLHDIHRIIKRVNGRGHFDLSYNPITSSILGLMLIEFTQIGNQLFTFDKEINAIIYKWLNQGRRGVLGAQRELLDLGYEELARI